jgi:hypothetical protein
MKVWIKVDVKNLLEYYNSDEIEENWYKENGKQIYFCVELFDNEEYRIYDEKSRYWPVPKQFAKEIKYEDIPKEYLI